VATSVPSAGIALQQTDIPFLPVSISNRSVVRTSARQMFNDRWRKVMKTRFTVTLSILAGAALGAAAVQGLHAQAQSLIYYVAEIDVTNPDAYGKEYALKMQAVIKSHGGRQLAIGGTAGAGAKAAVTAFDGAAPKRAVVTVWDSMEKIQAWRNDPQFKELRQIGEKYAKFRAYAIEGVAQ
jgi:uncharacterized protein (DUF1330 family)